jgi:mono/diheme cytochrome c family protein
VVLRQTLTLFVVVVGGVGLAMIPLQAQQPPQPAASGAPAGTQQSSQAGAQSSQAGAQGSQPAGNTMTPGQRADATAKGELKNPYSDSDAAAVDAGQKLYMAYACSGCHGGTGGGGMCPPLTNDIWVYGGDDDTLFRLIAYGSDTLQSKGYSRKSQENVVGAMPPMGQIVKTDEDLWHILAFVRANYHGAPECKLGCGAK